MLRDITTSELQKIFTTAIQEKVFPGAVIGITSFSERQILAFGRQAYYKEAPLINNESVFDVASITKTVPTAVLALMLIDKDKLSLQGYVKDYVPGLSGRWKDEIKICHLLAQTVSFGFKLSDFKERTPDEIINLIFSSDLKTRPGTVYAYNNSTSILLGKVLENVTGLSLSALAEKNIFFPLQMFDTTFYPDKSSLRIVPTENDPWRGRVLKGEVHDESAYVVSQNGVVGSAGLFTTASDLLNFLQMIVSDGSFKEKKILSKKTISLMEENYIIDLNDTATLGWEMRSIDSVEMIWKSGFTGCFIACDMKRKLGFVMLTNYHFPKRKNNFDALNNVRRLFVRSILNDKSF